MSAQVFQLFAHDNMTPAECLEYCARNAHEYQDVLVIGVDAEGKFQMNSSHITREFAVFLLLEALDSARGKR